MYTRNDYMNKVVSYREYYGQFVTKEVKVLVKHRIGLNRILKSADCTFRSIPMQEWDSLHAAIFSMVGRMMLEADLCSNCIGNTVCVAKEAACQIKEEHSNV